MGVDVSLVAEDGSMSCGWLPITSRIIDMDTMFKEEWDVACFSLESQYKIFDRINAKVKVHYILHYGVLYKDEENCLGSYAKPYYKITNSHWTANHLKKHLGYTPPIVYGGINKSLFHPMTVEKKYTVLTYGDKRRKWKGREDVEFIEMIMPKWKVGYMSDIDPDQEDIASVYSSAYVFFSASWYEGWNWMGLEAMACGVPLVITKDGGSEDYAKDGYNCLQVEPRKTDEAVLAIRRILVDKPLRKKLIANGLRTASKFTWQQSGSKFLKLISRELKEKKI